MKTTTLTTIILASTLLTNTGCVSEMLNGNNLAPSSNDNNTSTQKPGFISGILNEITKDVEERIDNKTKITQEKGNKEQATFEYKKEREKNRILDKIFGSDTKGKKQWKQSTKKP